MKNIRLMTEEQKELVLQNRKLVNHIVKKFPYIRMGDYEDVVSIGTIGLIKAAATFDQSKNITFSTYAGRCIENEIKMYFRQEKKSVHDVSLYDFMIQDDWENKMTFEDCLSDTDEDFIEKFETKETFIHIISIILNLLKKTERLVMLYSIAGKNQQFIAQTLNITQSYVSRMEKSLYDKIKLCLSQNYFGNLFSFSCTKGTFQIGFTAKDVQQFKQVFLAFLQSLTSTENLLHFQVSYHEERVVITVPADLSSFSFIAKMIQEMDNYIETVQPNPNQEFEKIMKLIKQNPANCKEPIEAMQQQSIIEKNHKEGANHTKKRGTYTKRIQNYVFAKENFTMKELRQYSPDIKKETIYHILTRAKKKGLIASVGRGKYVVKKN